MLQIQQISSWRSVYSSEMGDTMLLQSLGGFDQTILMTTITQAKQPMFKKPFILVHTFQVTPTTRGVSPAGSATSSMQVGITTAAYVAKKKPACMESPSPEALE